MHSTSYSRYYLVAIAFFSSLVLLLLGIALTPPFLRAISPLLLLPLVYAWILFYPAALPSPAIFILGLFSDVVTGLPLGSMPSIALLLYWLASREEKRIRRNFITIWLHFALHLTMAVILLIILLSLYNWRLPSITPILIQAALTLLCYPPMQGIVTLLLKQLRITSHD